MNVFSTKNIWFDLGISIGVLAGILCFVVFALPAGTPTWLTIAAWPGFVAWGLYFARGGSTDTMLKTIYANIFGIIIAALCLWLIGAVGITNHVGNAAFIGVIIIIAGFILTMGGNFAVTAYVPAAFCGCACAFGYSIGGVGVTFASGKGVEVLIATALSMIIGALLARLSDLWGTAMQKGQAA